MELPTIVYSQSTTGSSREAGRRGGPHTGEVRVGGRWRRLAGQSIRFQTNSWQICRAKGLEGKKRVGANRVGRRLDSGQATDPATDLRGAG